MVKTLTATVIVAIYLRLSRDDQNGSTESMSIAHQREMLLNYCNERGWNVYDIYIDDGYSGTTYDRPSFKRMIEDIEAGHINLVLTKDLSRLGRNYVMTGQYTDFFFPEHGVRYVAVNDGYDSEQEDNDIAPFKNILNEMYAKDISKKVRSARAVSAKQGKFMGSKPPYGYVKSPEDKHQLIIDPQTVEIVQRLFREFAGGDSARQIAERLNNEAIDTPAAHYFKQTGKRSTQQNANTRWGSATIMQLLKNQVYIGDMVQCKRKVSSFKTKKRLVTNPDGWVTVEGTHEAIIDKPTWECVQRRIAATRQTRNRNTVSAKSNGEISLFGGIIRCADCGASMAYNRRARKDGSELEFYCCSRYANSGAKSCSMHYTDMAVLKAVLLADIQHHARQAVQDEQAMTDRLLARCGAEQEKKQAANGKALCKAQERMVFIEETAKRLYEDKVTGEIPESLFKKMAGNYEKEMLELEARTAELQSTMQAEESREGDVQQWLALIKECADLTDLDRPTAFQLIDHVAVHECENEAGAKSVTIRVKYNFVGYLE